jgi:hypothetical protein
MTWTAAEMLIVKLITANVKAFDTKRCMLMS